MGGLGISSVAIAVIVCFIDLSHVHHDLRHKWQPPSSIICKQKILSKHLWSQSKQPHLPLFASPGSAMLSTNLLQEHKFYTQLQLEGMIDHDISCFSLLFPNVDVDWYLLHLSKGTSKSPCCSCSSLSCCTVSRKSDTILLPQEIQLEDGKSDQSPQLEPASGWDLWHKLSLQCLEMLHTQQLLLARIVKLKKARVFYNWQVILRFVHNIYRALGKPSLWREGAPEILQQNAEIRLHQLQQIHFEVRVLS